MVEVNNEASREKVKFLLKELFQFGMQDLDFGIYRIMNFKRKQIERFIDEDLIAAAEAEFEEYAKSGMVDLRNGVDRLRAEIVRDFGQGTIDEQGKVLKDKDAPKIREYLDKVSELESTKVTQSQIEDVFNHIYEFFSRYYDKGDFLSKRRYGGSEKYYVPYNGEEVLLHWANNDQYYVKTGEYFEKYSFKAGMYRVNFALKEADVKQNNIKVGPKYFILPKEAYFELDEKNRELTVFFTWRELIEEEKEKYGARDVQRSIVSDVVGTLFSKSEDSELGVELRKKADEERTVLEKNLSIYVERNTTDYFVHKSLKLFLERELDCYLKNEVLDLDEIEKMDEKYIRINQSKIRAIRGIGRKIIEFLGQIEDFQKMLFEKKKFILRTEYVITLDKLKEYCGEEFLNSILDEIVENSAQLEEWEKSFEIEIKSKKDLIEKQMIHNADFKKLPIDTKYFQPEFKLKLVAKLGEKNNLGEILDGILVKSENLQALNLLSPMFGDRIKTFYIDPPFNTGSDGFLYKDEYRHSSWLSLMMDRLLKARSLLRDDGNIFVHIDQNENSRLRLLLDDIFGPENYRNEIAVKRIKKNVSEYELVKSLNTDQDIIMFYSKTPESRILPPTKRSEKKPRWHSFEASGYRKGMDYELFGFVPRSGNHWRWSKERAMKAIEERRLRSNHNTGKPEYLVVKEQAVIGTTWDDISAYSFDHKFSTEKSEPLLRRIIEMGSNPHDVIADFFVGCGTTLATAQKLGRKWIGVDMGDFFDPVLLKRMKEVLFGDKTGISKDVEWKGGGFFKYHYVEQYEDALNNIVFREKDKTIQQTLNSFQDYFLRYMLEYETRESPTRLLIDKFKTPFDYKIKTINGNEESEETVDLVETFNYLLGLHAQKLLFLKDGERTYRVVLGKHNNENIIIIWRNTKDIDLQKDKKFIEENVLSGNTPDTIFTNGDSYIKNARAIEPEFRRLMGA